MSGRPCNDIEIGGTVSGKVTIDLVLETGGYGDFMRCDVAMAKRIRDRITKVVDGVTAPTEETQQKDAIEVDGLILRPGDFYFGGIPKISGIWGRSETEFWNLSQRHSVIILALTVEEVVHVLRETTAKQYYWIYLGPIPEVGQCKRNPDELIVGATYELDTKCIDNRWVYRFKNQVKNYESGLLEDWYWFTSSRGETIRHVTRGEILCLSESQP